LCSSAPDDINNAIGINSNTNPNPGDTVTFIMFPRGWAPSAQCDKFDWSFGDGGKSTELMPTHVYNNAGPYTVTLKLTGALSTATYTTTVTVGTPPIINPPGNNGGDCTAPQATSAYVGFTGLSSACTAIAGRCATGETVQFSLWPDHGYVLTCGNSTSVTWSYGDSTTGTGFSPTHTYTNPGLYHAQATLSNGGGTFTYPFDVQVAGTPQPKVCIPLTQQNVAVGWTGPGCTEISGSCKAADAIAFRPVTTGYDFSCNATHTYDWDFGDGSAHSFVAQPSHTFNNAGTYSIKLLVSNGTSSTTITRSMALITNTPVTGGPCAPMVPDVNVYVTYFGDCNVVSGNCSAKSDVAFAMSVFGYDVTCAPHTFSWDFGDGGHSTAAAPTHRYTADGTYRVTAHVTNGGQTVDLTATVKVVGATPSLPRGGHAVRH